MISKTRGKRDYYIDEIIKIALEREYPSSWCKSGERGSIEALLKILEGTIASELLQKED